MAKKKKKPKTIGELTNSRGEWKLNPVTKVDKDRSKYDRKAKHKKREEDY